MVIGVGTSGCIDDATLAAFSAEIIATMDEAAVEAILWSTMTMPSPA